MRVGGYLALRLRGRRVAHGGHARLGGHRIDGALVLARAWQRDLEGRIGYGIESLVRRHFAALKRPPRERPRPTIGVPDNDSTLVSIVTDPEQQSAQVSVLFKHPPAPERTVGDYRRALVGELYNYMLNQRLTEISRRPDAPFAFAGSAYGRFGPRTSR